MEIVNQTDNTSIDSVAINHFNVEDHHHYNIRSGSLARTICNSTAMACAHSIDAEQNGSLTFRASGTFGVNELIRL